MRGPGEDRPGYAVDDRGSELVVLVDGDVDFRTAPGLRDLLSDTLSVASARPGAGVQVDLSALVWMDSLGLGVLVAAWKRARAVGVRFALVDPSPKASAILRLARLDRVMPVLDSRTDDGPVGVA